MHMLHPYEEIENFANTGSLYLYAERCDKIMRHQFNLITLTLFIKKQLKGKPYEQHVLD